MKQNLIRNRLRALLQSNKGFTLVELLTSLSIFGFFSIALLNYMVTATSVTSNVSTSVSLSFQSGVALGMIEEYLIDCSGAVEFSESPTESVLSIVNNSGYDSTNPIVYIFTYDPAAKELYFHTSGAEKENIINSEGKIEAVNYKKLSSGGTTTPELLAMNIDAFKVTLNTGTAQMSNGSDLNIVQSVKIEFDMSLGRETYKGDTFISLRNNPQYSKFDESSATWVQAALPVATPDPSDTTTP